ncbi:BlaI/MecI/CopY family transcriptional regulator [Vallitalea guaymasensis]|uniref:BlaI/MecI/CopY family transcriptional regulator n=2 Tax=Vallitalea TaxID=1348611 RepID=A0A8J8SEF0_9FIRM|nr:BlaI/MecI/CopY family transcriptional regulator [Vallitalea guaymasensis]
MRTTVVRWFVYYKCRKVVNKMAKISESEWKVMKILWDKSPLTSKEIVDYVLEENDWSRKTVHTLISRLANKGVINVAKKNKYYEYSPCISKSDCQIEETKTFLEKVYNGSLQMFLTNFVKNQHLSKEEIAELKSIINNNPKEQK